MRYNFTQHGTTRCNAVQHVATQYNTLPVESSSAESLPDCVTPGGIRPPPRCTSHGVPQLMSSGDASPGAAGGIEHSSVLHSVATEMHACALQLESVGIPALWATRGPCPAAPSRAQSAHTVAQQSWSDRSATLVGDCKAGVLSTRACSGYSLVLWALAARYAVCASVGID